VDGAHGLDGICLFSLFGDGGGDLQSVEHEGGAFAVHGLEVEGADDLSYGEEDRGGVFEGRDLGRAALLHAVEFHVEEAVGLASEGCRAAALSIALDVAALLEH